MERFVSIVIACKHCDREYRLADEMAGRSMNCKSCGLRFAVPESAPKKKKRRKKSSLNVPLLAAIGGVLVIVVMVLVAVNWRTENAMNQSPENSGSPNTNAMRVSPYGLTPAPAPTPEQSMAREAADWKVFCQSNGAATAQIVFVGSNVGVEPAPEWFDWWAIEAASHEYRQDVEHARLATEANKKAAEQKAIANAAPNQIGVTWYRYQNVQPTLKFPTAISPTSLADRNVLFINNVVDFNSLVARLKTSLGSKLEFVAPDKIDPSQRRVELAVKLPAIIPDERLEAFRKTHGENVARIVIQNWDFGNKLLLEWVREVVQQGRAGITGYDGSGSKVSFLVSAVDDIENLAQQLPWEGLPRIEPERKVITGRIKVPDDIAAVKFTRPLTNDDHREHLSQLDDQQVREVSRPLQDGEVLKADMSIFIEEYPRWRECEVVEILPRNFVYVHEIGSWSFADKVVPLSRIRVAFPKPKPSPLAGGDGGGPFTDAKPEGILYGVEWSLGIWAGQQRLGTIRPLYSPSNSPRANQSLAPEGYAVGAIRIWGTDFVNGLQLVFMKLKDDGTLDPDDIREGKWLVRSPEADFQTLSGEGHLLCGIHGRKALIIDALGIVIQPEPREKK